LRDDIALGMKPSFRLLIVVVAILFGVASGFHSSAPTTAQVVQTADAENHEPISAQPPAASNAPDVVSSHVAASNTVNSSENVTLQRSPNGHFYADVMVNGVAIHALVDTGATTVAFSRDDAARVGINPGPADFSGVARTANGETRFAPVTLNSVSLGSLTRSDIPAAVMNGEMGQTLLGMTFLSKFKVKIDGDTMVLS